MDPKHYKNIAELAGQFASAITGEAERLAKSGGIDIEAYDPRDYGLAKILLSAAIQNKLHTIEPLLPRNRAAVRNLRHF